MTTDQIPVVLEDGTVEYLPGDTIVTWWGMDAPQPLSAVERDWVTIVEDKLTLPDGRRCRIEGWKDEALRLRAARAARSDIDRTAQDVAAAASEWRSMRARGEKQYDIGRARGRLDAAIDGYDAAREAAEDAKSPEGRR